MANSESFRNKHGAAIPSQAVAFDDFAPQINQGCDREGVIVSEDNRLTSSYSKAREGQSATERETDQVCGELNVVRNQLVDASKNLETVAAYGCRKEENNESLRN